MTLPAERRFSTSMDGVVLGISIGYFVLIVLVAAVTQNLWITLFLVAVAVGSYLVNPTHYTVSASELRIHRLAGMVKVPLASITRVEQLVRPPYIRVFGIGGLFGYYGLYWSKETGTVRMYGRNRRHPVLLALRSGRPIVIMPDDTSILDALRAFGETVKL